MSQQTSPQRARSCYFEPKIPGAGGPPTPRHPSTAPRFSSSARQMQPPSRPSISFGRGGKLRQRAGEAQAGVRTRAPRPEEVTVTSATPPAAPPSACQHPARGQAAPPARSSKLPPAPASRSVPALRPGVGGLTVGPGGRRPRRGHPMSPAEARAAAATTAGGRAGPSWPRLECERGRHLVSICPAPARPHFKGPPPAGHFLCPGRPPARGATVCPRRPRPRGPQGPGSPPPLRPPTAPPTPTAAARPGPPA